MTITKRTKNHLNKKKGEILGASSRLIKCHWILFQKNFNGKTNRGKWLTGLEFPHGDGNIFNILKNKGLEPEKKAPNSEKDKKTPTDGFGFHGVTLG